MVFYLQILMLMYLIRLGYTQVMPWINQKILRSLSLDIWASILALIEQMNKLIIVVQCLLLRKILMDGKKTYEFFTKPPLI